MQEKVQRWRFMQTLIRHMEKHVSIFKTEMYLRNKYTIS